MKKIFFLIFFTILTLTNFSELVSQKIDFSKDFLTHYDLYGYKRNVLGSIKYKPMIPDCELRDTSIIKIDILSSIFSEIDSKVIFNELNNFSNIIFLKVSLPYNRPENKETDLPEFKELKNIEFLSLSNISQSWLKNGLWDQLSQMPKLKYLIIHSKRYSYKDIIIDNPSLLNKLTGLKLQGGSVFLPKNVVSSSLEVLILMGSSNRKIRIEKNISNLKNFPNLKEIIIDNTKTTIEPNLFAELNNLRKLSLTSGNINFTQYNFNEFLPNLESLELYVNCRNHCETLILPRKLKNLKIVSRGGNFNVRDIWNCRELENLSIRTDTEVKIENVKLNQLKNLKKLKINLKSIDILPKIFSLSNLEELRLIIDYYNSPKIVISDDIKKLKNLKKLSVIGKLEAFPKQIFDLKNLVELELIGNNFFEIPFGISKLKNLQKLTLNSNRLSFLNDDIGELKNLEYLNVENNLLEDISESLIKLTNLKQINFENNYFSKSTEEIPPGFNMFLKNLQNLNHLEELNFKEAIKNNGNEVLAILMNLHNEKLKIDLGGCVITELPKLGWSKFLCKSLNLESNKIKNIPDNIIFSKIPLINFAFNKNSDINVLKSGFDYKWLAYEQDKITLDSLKSDPQFFQKGVSFMNRNELHNPPMYKIFEKIDSVVLNKAMFHRPFGERLLKNKEYSKSLDHIKRAIENYEIFYFMHPHYQHRHSIGYEELYYAQMKSGDTLGAINSLKQLANRYSLEPIITLLYKQINDEKNLSIRLKTYEQKHFEKITSGRPDSLSTYLSLMEWYILTEQNEKYEDIHHRISKRINSRHEIYPLFRYLELLSKVSNSKIDYKIEKFQESLDSKYPYALVYRWSCRLVKFWSTFQSQKIRERVEKLNSIICNEDQAAHRYEFLYNPTIYD